MDVELVCNETSNTADHRGKAYGSWSKHKMAFALYNHGIELVEIPEAELLPNKGNDIGLQLTAWR